METKKNVQFMSMGKELDFSIVDFWEWHCGNWLDSSIRGSLAEFIVLKALGVE